MGARDILTDILAAGLVLNGRSVGGADRQLATFNATNPGYYTSLRHALAAYLDVRPIVCALALGGMHT